jgi:hypothetical protein
MRGLHYSIFCTRSGACAVTLPFFFFFFFFFFFPLANGQRREF